MELPSTNHYSIIITIGVGFSMIIISLVYFEGNNVLRMLTRKFGSKKSRKQGRKVTIVEDRTDRVHLGPADDKHPAHNESYLDEQAREDHENEILKSLNRLQKKSELLQSGDTPQIGFDEYASNRQD